MMNPFICYNVKHTGVTRKFFSSVWSRAVYLFSIVTFLSVQGKGQQLVIEKTVPGYSINLVQEKKSLLHAPAEGLWSIATGWDGGWPSQWHHIQVDAVTERGEWKELTGKLRLAGGEWLLKDAYREENGRVKCIRRFEWKGKDTLQSVTLSVRWIVPASSVSAFLPGILYYGNPSGEKNGPDNVAWYHCHPGEELLFEEHRFPMPFSSAEWHDKSSFYGAALHSVPSPVINGNRLDQWWSLGIKAHETETELELLSGPVACNGVKNVTKALQSGMMPYGNTFMKVLPGTVIEKSFYLETYPVAAAGSGFQRPLYSSIDIFKPFYTGDLPSYTDIIKKKYRFANSRWLEGKGFAGYNMFPSFVKPQIVMGWAGQCEAPAYALQVLNGELGDPGCLDKVQRSLDHLCTSTMDSSGFKIIYDINTGKWIGSDPVSQGQAMNNIALAIEEAKFNKKLITTGWQKFLKKAAAVFARRILSPDWHPHNTAEAFFISPLLKSSRLFNEPAFRKAGLKAAEYYAGRHLNMAEPYWGGTLDATCEDKEGAWGAFQGFLAAYELTKEKKFLYWAKHACDVTLSYTVVWDIPLPPGRLSDNNFKTRGWTGVSAQNQHLDVYGVLIAPAVYKMGIYLNNKTLKRLARTMFLSCGQLTDPSGSQGEQIQQTNFAQRGDMTSVSRLRGGYSEDWTVFWITAHFLHAAASFKKMGIRL